MWVFRGVEPFNGYAARFCSHADPPRCSMRELSRLLAYSFPREVSRIGWQLHVQTSEPLIEPELFSFIEAIYNVDSLKRCRAFPSSARPARLVHHTGA